MGVLRLAKTGQPKDLCKMSSNTLFVEPGLFYHICNRAVGNEQLFRHFFDYNDWMMDLEKIILPVANLHAYCILDNHYHLLVRIRECTNGMAFSKSVNRLQSIHAKRFNYKYQRKGSLFISPFNRIPVKDDAQLAWVLWYIHRNPLHHGKTENWEDYSYSSYCYYKYNRASFLDTSYMFDFFGGQDQLIQHHQSQADAYLLNNRELRLE
jgi:REP element-mobilizing transposase RayT